MSQTVYQAGMCDPEQWDDTLLIQQYNEAMDRVKRRVVQRIEKQTSEEGKSEMSQSEDTSDKHTSKATAKKKKRKSKNRIQWCVGDPCRCVFEEDGWEYEATVTAIRNHRATVEFLGYGNTQTCSTNALVKSKGHRARQRQEAEAANCSEAEESGVDEGSSSDKASGGGGAEGVAGPWQPVGGHGPSPPHGVGMHHFPPHATPPFLPPHGSHHPPEDLLPPPPPPPGLPLDDEPLHTMLMSWYMTGYHTGYYKGLHAKRGH